MSFFDEDDTQEQEEESFFSLRTPVPGPSSPSVRVADPDPDGRGISVEPSEESNRPEDSAALLEETERRRKQQLETEGNVVQRLSRRWIDERHAPELLVHDAHGEMDECLQMLLRQQDAVNDLRADMANWDEVEHIRLLLVQQDIERIRWLVSSIMRTRLSKIEAQHVALLQDANYRQRLSFEEQQYLDRYEVLRTNDLQSLVLNLLPKKLQSLNDHPDMLNGPDLDQAVYIQVLSETDPIRLPDGTMHDLHIGSIHMLRYRSVKGLLAVGKVKLV